MSYQIERRDFLKGMAALFASAYIPKSVSDAAIRISEEPVVKELVKPRFILYRAEWFRSEWDFSYHFRMLGRMEDGSEKLYGAARVLPKTMGDERVREELFRQMDSMFRKKLGKDVEIVFTDKVMDTLKRGRVS